jgi:hypothetical protein
MAQDMHKDLRDEMRANYVQEHGPCTQFPYCLDTQTCNGIGMLNIHVFYAGANDWCRKNTIPNLYLLPNNCTWPHCLRQSFTVACLLGLRVQITPGHRCLSLVKVV